jgi:hypothetical protein
MTGITCKPFVVYPVLTPKLKSDETLVAAGMEEVAVVTLGSKTFTQKFPATDCRGSDGEKYFAYIVQ